MATEPEPETNWAEWGYAAEACRILGISKKTLRERADKGDIPSVRMFAGSSRRYHLPTLRQIAAGTYRPEPKETTAR